VTQNNTPTGDEIVQLLDPVYPRIKTPLEHSNPFQLLIATMLSAQCTDEQVNKVTPALFKMFPDAERMSGASTKTLERVIRSTGFFHVKSKRIKDVSRLIVEDFAGKVPETMEQLVTLPGVGRKTANIVLSAGFDKLEGVAVDTHVQRLSQRIGLSEEKTPEKIELDLMKITKKESWARLTMLLILHGRTVCFARKPQCEKCILANRCKYNLERIKETKLKDQTA
jgi:endonuclease III